MKLEEWKEKNQQAKSYAHFDERVSLKNSWMYISNPQNVAKHGFYPFIHYRKEQNKYKRKGNVGEIVPKKRDLYYSAHLDRYVFSYYGYLVNEAYNKYVALNNIDETAIAYRNNLGKSNIHFAKQAFDAIRNTGRCYVIIGDFTNFFDSLDHKYLKAKLCDVLNVKELPSDYYAVFKNITKFSMWELNDLLALNNLDESKKSIRVLNSKNKVLNTDDFRKYKREYIRKNVKDYGIPQGSAISAVFANVYMIDADKEINAYVKSLGGLYMRYSDDFIVVLPKTAVKCKIAYEFVTGVLDSVPNLELQPSKTQIYEYNEGRLKNCNSEYIESATNGKDSIDFLGFSFDGKEVTIRDKTITKYYYKLYRKINTIIKQRGYTKDGKKISCKNLYARYSEKGARAVDSEGHIKGNFLSYVQRAKAVFGDEPIERKTKRHMTKIRRRLDKVFNN